jgi:Uncharacterized membrane-associated protein
MNLAWLIAHYGYAALFVGCLLEGETLLVLAGYAAHRGYLDFEWVVALAWLGAMLGDQLFFWLGRRRGRTMLDRFPTLDARFGRALAWIERHPDWSILAMRFLWGLRSVLPLALGMSRVSWLRFALLNALSAAVWASLVATLGWSFGALIARHAPTWHRYEHWGMGVVVIVALAWHGWQRRRAHRATLAKR